MDSHDVDMPMYPITNYTSPPPELPLPSSSTASTTTGILPSSNFPQLSNLANIVRKMHAPPFSKSSGMMMARLSFVSKRWTQRGTSEGKRWRPTWEFCQQLAANYCFWAHQPGPRTRTSIHVDFNTGTYYGTTDPNSNLAVDMASS